MELPSLTRALQLLWLLPILPLLWWLARPPRPRQRLLTAHRAQWLLAQAAVRRRPLRFRTLRWLLLSAAATAATLAVATPVLRGGGGPRRVVVLLDGSASGARRLGDGSAFGRGVELARAALAAVPVGVDVEVAWLGNGTIARRSGAAARALAAPPLPGGELPAALPELAAEAMARTDTAVLVVSDDAAALGALPVGIHRLGVGRPLPNAAIARVVPVDSWPQAALHLDVEVASFGDAVLTGTLLASGAIAAVPAMPVTLAPGEHRTVALELQRIAAGGELTLHLAIDGDGLPLDDEVLLRLPPLPEPRIAVVADGDGARLLRDAGAALAEAVGAACVDAAPGTRVGFLLTEGGRADLAPGSAAMVTFGTIPAAGQPEVWSAPALVDWSRDDPLLAGLDLSELNVAHAMAAALPPGRPLLLGSLPRGGTAPLAVAVEGRDATSVHFAFRLQDSNLGLLPALPQLLLRAFRLGHRQGQGISLVRAPIPAAESDLRGAPPPPDRPLPAWPAPPEDLGPWCLAAALLCVAVRACIR